LAGEKIMTQELSPDCKCFLAGLIGVMLLVLLMMGYALSWDRQNQVETAQASIVAVWGGP
jgi:inner membrane protein